jgi:hypothetical protein
MTEFECNFVARTKKYSSDNIYSVKKILRAMFHAALRFAKIEQKPKPL